jgi:hypothetical protein
MSTRKLSGPPHITDLSVADISESARNATARKGGEAMSRHHILPPIIYTPAPPKPKETKRKRGVGQLRGTREADEASEAEETGETTHSAPTRGPSALPQQQIPVEGAERKIPSPNGKLSDDTLKAMLEMQEMEGAKDVESS